MVLSISLLISYFRDIFIYDNSYPLEYCLKYCLIPYILIEVKKELYDMNLMCYIFNVAASRVRRGNFKSHKIIFPSKDDVVNVVP